MNKYVEEEKQYKIELVVDGKVFEIKQGEAVDVRIAAHILERFTELGIYGHLDVDGESHRDHEDFYNEF